MKHTNEYLDDESKKNPLVINNFLEASRCEEYIEQFNKHVPRPRSYQGVVNATLRECQFVILPSDYVLDFQRFAEQYLESYFKVSISLENAHAPIAFRYPPGVGFVAHHDLVTPIEIERGKYNGQPIVGGDFTVVLFLNKPEDYKGGELFFPNHNLSVKPPQGSIVAFPAKEYYIHEVRPIIEGVRYSAMCRAFYSKNSPSEY